MEFLPGRKWRKEIWTPKTKAGQRSLLIIPELEPYLQQLSTGINRSRQALEQRFECIRRRSGLMKVAYPHCLRATFATRLAEQGINVYGKTGSTEKPDSAWFAGFAEDSKARSIAIAVIVEGGQHGSSDAAPLARDIIHFCIDAEYIGKI